MVKLSLKSYQTFITEPDGLGVLVRAIPRFSKPNQRDSSIKVDEFGIPLPEGFQNSANDGVVTGKLGEINLFHETKCRNAGYEMIVGLGDVSVGNGQLTYVALLDRVRNMAASATRSINRLGIEKVIFHHLPYDIVKTAEGTLSKMDVAYDLATALFEGALLGLYSFRKSFKVKANATIAIKQICLLWDENVINRDELAKLEARSGATGKANANAAILARTLVNSPPNIMTPAKMAAHAQEIADSSGGRVTCTIFDDIKKSPLSEMGAYLGVAQGSNQPPKLIRLAYKGRPDSKNHIFLIGKSITFDSGGLSLKPPAAMRNMKADMGGGAAVLAAIAGIAELKLKVNVTVLSPAAENMPSGTAQRPGDIVKTMDGTYVEVDNTDAEGRLTLADTITYAKLEGATHIIDVATLTGAIRVALGYSYTGGYSNDEHLLQLVVNASHECGEPVWPLPIDDVIRDHNKSEVADLRNTGDRMGYGGASTAAAFIEHFVKETPWVHLDIAGTSMSPRNRGILSIGATGVAARTLIRLAETFEDKIMDKREPLRVNFWPRKLV